MIRITDKHLQAAVDRLNRITDSPMAPYSMDEHGKLKANPGNYHIDGAYGGVKLVRMDNGSGGITNPIYMGFETKRKCYELIHSYINGIESTHGK